MKINKSNFFQVPNIFFQGLGAKKMDYLEMLIYLYFASFCFGDKTQCFPTQERISNELGIALSTVKDKIRYMAKRGVIRIARTSRGGKAKWNSYELATWDELEALPDWYNIREQERRDKKCSSDERSPISQRNDDFANQPLEQPPNSRSNSRQSDINNTNSIILSNKKNLAAGAAEISLDINLPDVTNSTNLQKNKLPDKNNEKNETEEKLETDDCDDIDDFELARKEDEEYEKANRYNNRNKPRDITKMQFPNASLKEIKDKIYFYFKNNNLNWQGHQNNLYNLDETYLEKLIKGNSFLSYWSEYKYGDNSLTMFIRYLDDFISKVEEERYMYERQWEHDNNDLLVDDYIKANNVFDIRKKENMNIINDILLGNKDKLSFNQQNWIACSPDSIVFVWNHLSPAGYHILHKEVAEISNTTILKLITTLQTA